MGREHWRNRQQLYSLIGEVCRSQQCQDNKIFPPRDLCPDCGEKVHESHQFSGRGEIYSSTTVNRAPAGHEENSPYPVALVRLEEGPLVTAQLTDLGNRPVEIGMPVEMVTRKLKSDGDRGILIYGYKFRPLLEADSQSR